MTEHPKDIGLAFARIIPDKKARKEIRRSRPKVEPATLRKRLIKKIDTLIQRAVCYRDSIEGPNGRWGFCVSCSRPVPFNRLQGGHFIPRSNWGTRWLWECVNGQCDHCNRPSGPPAYGLAGNYAKYREVMVHRHGARKVKAWEDMKKNVREPTLDDVEKKLVEVKAIIEANGWHE